MESKIIVTTYTFRKPLELIWKIIKDTRLINQLPETFNKKINQGANLPQWKHIIRTRGFVLLSFDEGTGFILCSRRLL